MKKKLTAVIAVMAALAACAQTPAPMFIKGTMNIKFDTKTRQGAGAIPPGVADTYAMNVNACNSAIFRGTVTALPLIVDNGYFSSSVKQNRSLTYDLMCDVVNPRNPSQTKNVGRINGRVQVDPNGAYRYSDGTLACSILPIGTAGQIDSKFGGVALGKPLGAKAQSGVQKALLNITKQVQGKTVTVAVKKYDKMIFQNHVLCAGPVGIYREVTINGEMVYDYDRYAWYFNNVTMQYQEDGLVKIDRLTGDIRWTESPDRKTSGEGQYDFDIRVNEPPPSEAQAFNQATDESAFFTSDSAIPGLTGTMKYKDTLNPDGDTLASDVTIDLAGNKLTKQQMMGLCKLLMLSAIVPMNSD